MNILIGFGMMSAYLAIIGFGNYDERDPVGSVMTGVGGVLIILVLALLASALGGPPAVTTME